MTIATLAITFGASPEMAGNAAWRQGAGEGGQDGNAIATTRQCVSQGRP
jgi:hypothetical protein